MKAKPWMIGAVVISLIGLATITAVAVLTEDDKESALKPRTTDEALVVHEWGTFTSVYGSDGGMLTKLEVEEEHLPGFVHNLDQLPQTLPATKSGGAPIVFLGKGYARPVHNVTVKMETPVLYFYSAAAMDVRVKVGFDGGSISQWYPQRISGEMPPPMKFENGKMVATAVDFAGEKPYQGSIEWKARIEAPHSDDDFRVMKDGETPSWLHPRAPKSNLLSLENGETEKYLFYRGIGNFELPLGFRFNSDEELAMSSAEAIPFLLLYHKQGDSVRILWRGPLDSGDAMPVNLGAEIADSDSGSSAEMREPIYQCLKTSLVDAGLSDDEAAAMLRTWWHSYMHRDGLRAFWVVPRAFTDRVLPIEIEPAPAQLERVLLGRSEILTPAFERKLIKEYAKEADKNAFRYDRYFQAYGERVNALTGKK